MRSRSPEKVVIAHQIIVIVYTLHNAFVVT